jgi:hypothetical protein
MALGPDRRLTDSNLVLYAASVYDNPQCESTEEFVEDLRRIKYVKKLLTRYETTGELREKLVLNHLVVLGNVFPADCLVRMLFLKMPGHLRYLKPFLVALSLLPTRVEGIGREMVGFDTDEIEMDQGVIDALRRIAPTRGC